MDTEGSQNSAGGEERGLQGPRWEGRGGQLPNPASDLGSSQRGPPSFSPPPAPSFLSGRMRPGISTSFWKVPEVNEGEARNTTRGMKFWEERNLDLG